MSSPRVPCLLPPSIGYEAGMTLSRLFTFSLVALALGCGDSSHDGHDGGGAAAQGGSGEGGAGAPVLDRVDPMHGALHLYWTNVSGGCDTVEGERKVGATSAFAPLFTVPGTVDNKADDAATDPMVSYTYRLRCKKGDVYSAYSNERSASPSP